MNIFIAVFFGVLLLAAVWALVRRERKSVEAVFTGGEAGHLGLALTDEELRELLTFSCEPVPAIELAETTEPVILSEGEVIPTRKHREKEGYEPVVFEPVKPDKVFFVSKSGKPLAGRVVGVKKQENRFLLRRKGHRAPFGCESSRVAFVAKEKKNLAA